MEKLANQKEKFVMKVDWQATLKAIPIGKSETFRRKEVTVSNLRTYATALKKKGYVFVVKSYENDDYAVVTRER